jgi:hypothetical protein
VHQGTAIIEKDVSNSSQINSKALLSELRQIYRSIQKWVDINDEKVTILKFKNETNLIKKKSPLIID